MAVQLVNRLAVTHAHGRPVEPSGDRLPAVLAAAAELSITARWELTRADADRLAGVAAGLRPVFAGGVVELNALLERHAAIPNLHGDPPTLSFHRADASLVDAWASASGTALAMVIGVGQGARLGTCQAIACDLVYFDTTRNASRRFCGLSCQNRAKATAYRARRSTL